MRRWSVAERIQGWKVGDKNCVTSVYKALIYEIASRNALLKQLHRRLDHQEGYAGAGWQRGDEERGLGQFFGL